MSYTWHADHMVISSVTCWSSGDIQCYMLIVWWYPVWSGCTRASRHTHAHPPKTHIQGGHRPFCNPCALKAGLWRSIKQRFDKASGPSEALIPEHRQHQLYRHAIPCANTSLCQLSFPIHSVHMHTCTHTFCTLAPWHTCTHAPGNLLSSLREDV